MAVKVGNSWVSEEAYAYAKGKMEAENAKGDKKTNADMLSELSEKYPGAKFSTNTAPFSAKGKNNIAISPNILQEMQNDPEKRLEYEALIYDCEQAIKSGAFRREGCIAGGFIIDSNGGLGAWSISQAKGTKVRKSFALDKKDKGSWIEKIQEKMKTKKKEAIRIEKKKAEKAEKEKRAEKVKENHTHRSAIERSRGRNLDIKL